MTANILAVAVGESDTGPLPLSSSSPKVRPYIQGLQFGLSLNGYALTTDYTIEYHQKKASSLDSFFRSKASTLGANDIVFCMSTGVVDNAVNYIKVNAIVGVVSNYSGYPSNVCGYSAQRVQQAADCYQSFQSMISEEIWVLYQPAYGPSKTALDNIHKKFGITLNTVDVTEGKDILAGLAAVPSGNGVLVLPIDRCFGEADDIVAWQNDLTKNKNKIPIFWPATDWVGTGKTAFGGYGVPQEFCGYRMGEQVAYVWSNGEIPAFEVCQTDDPDIKWLASRQTATALGFTLTAQMGLEII